MIDVLMSAMVLLVVTAGTTFFVRRMPQIVRPLVWLAYGEYILCTIVQMVWTRLIVEGGDTLLYTERGGALAKYLDQSFWFTAPEVLRLLFQQPSGVDHYADIVGLGTNTGSMFAMSAFTIFFLGGSEYAAHALVAGGSFFGALLVFKALNDAQPDLNPRGVFLATVLFPSIAFWTCAFHKESFCLMGIGLALTAWRGVYRRKWLRVVLCTPLAILLLGLFRAPTIPPLALGLALYLIYDRFRKARGAEVVILGPLYLAVGFVLVAAGMILVSQLDPSLAVDKLGDTMGQKQAQWGKVEGGSTLESSEDVAPATPMEQLANVPIALLNALFRPQIFDIHNVGTAVSAVEMSIVTYFLIRSLLRTGVRGILSEIEKSPLLLMCAVITFVGCTFVGLVTLNLGSLARYRVPFLPFYGTGIVFLSERLKQTRAGPVAKSAVPAAGPRLAPAMPKVAPRWKKV